MTRHTLLIAIAALALVLIGVMVIAQDNGSAPVTAGGEGTRVEAPGTRVESNSEGTRIQAPGVDITVPRNSDGD